MGGALYELRRDVQKLIRCPVQIDAGMWAVVEVAIVDPALVYHKNIQFTGHREFKSFAATLAYVRSFAQINKIRLQIQRPENLSYKRDHTLLSSLSNTMRGS